MSHLIHQIKINLKDNRTLHKMSNSLEEQNTIYISGCSSSIRFSWPMTSFKRCPDSMGCPYLWAGWRLSPTPLKNDGVKVSWDDEIPFPTEWKVIKAMFQTFPNHQPDGGVPKIV
jgi:hypothetical protein